jgi:thiol-disulfide isomerase/thioredoxin
MNSVVTVLALLVLTLLAWRFWGPLVAPAPKREVPKGEATLYFFYTDWCGWSQKAMPEWEKLESTIASTPVFGTTTVKIVRVNAETDRATTDLYEVEGYPTIKLETSDSLQSFDKIPTHEGLLQFLRSSLGKETKSL